VVSDLTYSPISLIANELAYELANIIFGSREKALSYSTIPRIAGASKSVGFKTKRPADVLEKCVTFLEFFMVFFALVQSLLGE
jgi:hypothetical protein